MLIDKLVNSSNDKLSFTKIEDNTYRVNYPCYHDDGDMYDIFLKVNDEGRLELCDMGATLMRLSYSFELNSDTRMEILGDILQSSCIENNRGNLYVATTEDDFLQNLLNFSLVMSKIVNMDILKRDVIQSLFIEQVREYVTERVQKMYKVERDTTPVLSLPYKVNYEISKTGKPPVYLTAINSPLQAVRTTAVYSQLMQAKKPCFSVAVHENIDKLSSIDRNALTNATDKQFTSYMDFKEHFEHFLESKIA